ncbi:MAG: ABC transporter ATP-binding protein [Phycisphaerales bacterium JB040]
MSLCAESITVRYGKAVAVEGASCAIERGEVVGIIGPNGCGKSSLVRAMGALLSPASGTVTLDGAPVRALGARERARRLAVLPQHPVTPPGLTVEDLVRMGRAPHRPPHAEHVERAMGEADVLGLRSRHVSSLSGGERQRAWIAMTLAQQTDHLLLDEPTASLDVGHAIGVLELVGRLARERSLGVGVVIHDLNLAARVCTRLVAMRDGGVIADGPADGVLTAGLVRTLYGVEATVERDPSGRPVCRFDGLSPGHAPVSGG